MNTGGAYSLIAPYAVIKQKKKIYLLFSEADYSV